MPFGRDENATKGRGRAWSTYLERQLCDRLEIIKKRYAFNDAGVVRQAIMEFVEREEKWYEERRRRA